MNRIEVVLRAAATHLAELRLGWALVGGLAVSARTEPRFTRDIDLVIAVRSDTDAEQAVHALRLRGYHILALVEQETAGRLATARLIPPGQDGGEDGAGIVLDILFASSGIEAEVASMADLAELLRAAGPDDLERARRAVSLIHTGLPAGPGSSTGSGAPRRGRYLKGTRPWTSES